MQAVVGLASDGVVDVTRPITDTMYDGDIRHSTHPRLTQLTHNRLDEVAYLSAVTDT